MTVSAAKLEANRRNSQKSTGPRTEAGKRVSSRNAVTHGLRAETLVLPDEDPQALEERQAAWAASLSPRGDAEQRAVDDAVVYSWMQDRARRAQVARLRENIADDRVHEIAMIDEEVLQLGRRLFTDRLGPLTFYPTGCEYDEMDDIREPSTSYDQRRDISDEPAMLVLRLQSTLAGCEWLLGEWANLKAILEEGQPWIPSDKLKAVRLLGKQPFDAIDDRDVAMVFLASSVLRPSKREWYWEISMEMTDSDTTKFRRNATARQLESLKPADAEAARCALVAMIERATGRLTAKAEVHRERDRVKAAVAADVLAFDDTVEGERLRRHELASGRAMARSLDTLHKLRRAPLPVVGRPLSVVGCGAEAIPSSMAPNESTDQSENVTNEPTDRWENAANEPTGRWENATNEPSDQSENVTNEPTGRWENVPNEPTGRGLRNEEGQRENASNEPTASGTRLEGGRNEDPTNQVLDRAWPLVRGDLAGNEKIVNHVATEEALESYEGALKRIRVRREEITRQLNEQARREAAEAMAARRALRREQVANKRKPVVLADQPEALTGRKRLYETAAQQVSDLEKLVKASLGLLDKRKVAPD